MFCAGRGSLCGAAYAAAQLRRDGFYLPPRWDGKKAYAVADFAEAVRLAAAGSAVALLAPGGGMSRGAARLLASAAEADLSALPPEAAERVADAVAETREAIGRGGEASGARG